MTRNPVAKNTHLTKGDVKNEYENWKESVT